MDKSKIRWKKKEQPSHINSNRREETTRRTAGKQKKQEGEENHLCLRSFNAISNKSQHEKLTKKNSEKK
ncbi:hypothetical protein E2C01_008837 [Portunus trituberculatus]|uniref:Uncharacterized protein n=1 Tax=Portunus trituberculatus TaxID=210409 RepID=A0A5B7D305_PORTR|nr:hypothetical protein [Portunus trituberculatus]